jgi:tetratricopeptide (TPR) repeat protein
MRTIVLTLALSFLAINFAQASSLVVNPAYAKLGEALKAGDFKTLIKRAGDIVEDQPQDGRAWYFLGLGQLQSGGNTECAHSFAKAAELLAAERPFVIVSLIYRGTCALRAGMTAEAEDALRRGMNLIEAKTEVTKQLPADYIDWPVAERELAYGRALMRFGQYALALPWIEHYVVAFNPKSAAARLARAEARLALGDFDGASSDMHHYRTLAGKDEVNDSASYIEMYAALGLGNEAAARRALDSAKGDVSEMRRVLRYLAGEPAAGAEIGRMPRLGIGFGKASKGVTVNDVTAGSTAETAGLRRGDVLLRLNDKAVDAGNFTSTVRSLHAGQVVAIVYRRGDEEKSVSAAMKTRDDQPGGWQAEYRQWALASRVFGRMEALQAAAAAKQAGDRRSELRHLSTAFRHSPNDTALLRRIMTLVASLKPPPAIPEEAQRLAESATQDSASTDSVVLGRAAAAYQEATGHAPWWGDLYINLGLIEEKLGRFTDARRHLEMFLVVSPNTPDAPIVTRKIHEMDFRNIMHGK